MQASGSLGWSGGVESVTIRRIASLTASGLGHQGDRVAVGLAHLAAVEAGKRRDALGDERPRLPQHVAAVRARELLCEVDGDLEVLCLVGADGHLVGVEGEDVRGHQDRIAVQAHVDPVVGIPARFGVGGDRCLVGVRAVEHALRGHVAQQGRQPRDRRHPALAVQVHVGAIEPARQQRGGQSLRPVGQHGGIGMAVERVQVGDEQVDVALLVGGEAGQGPDRAGVVAQVQLAGRLEARQRRDGAAGGGGRVRGHGDLLLVRAPGSRTGASEVTVGARWPAPSGVGPELRPGSQYAVWIGLPASGRPTTTPRAARAAPGRRRCCCAAVRSWCTQR